MLIFCVRFAYSFLSIVGLFFGGLNKAWVANFLFDVLTFYVQRAYFFLSIAGLFLILIVDVKLAQILNEVLIFYLKISNVDITMQIQSNLILHSKSLSFLRINVLILYMMQIQQRQVNNADTIKSNEDKTLQILCSFINCACSGTRPLFFVRKLMWIQHCRCNTLCCG